MPSFETPYPQSARRAAMVLLAWVIGAMIAGCSPSQRSVEIRFELADALQSQQVQFYVHSIELLNQDGRWESFEIEAQSPWQSERLALVDLGAHRTSQGRNVVMGKAGLQGYEGLRLTIGVPFDLNHSNPLTALPPLDRPSMFWSWQSGYKFIRIDLSATEHEAAFHLGSTGCSSASALRPPAQACAQPNLMRVELQGFDPLQHAIRVNTADVAAALNQGDRPACTGDYSSPGCQAAYALTGLNLAKGACAQSEAGIASGSSDNTTAVCVAQRLFAVAGSQSSN